ncbi:sialic acid-binding Ig-like lectin 10 [Gracilinanus agilis]|uniref:sialic acid-binding Ig-like lectin 10 n=1 Tax=Gracilinanus agilis TaxID=191870 RepID=UPI001CFE9DA7|nr:sialic acid-binding Ig-like lectin 10 [Gracilinanus agilis]
MLLLLLLLSSLRGSQSQKEGYKLQVSQAVAVQEGLCVYIPCTFFYPLHQLVPPPIHGYWFKFGPKLSEDDPMATNDQTRNVNEEAKGRFHLVGDPGKDNCSLSIVDVQRRDSGQYFFRMKRGPTEKFSYLSYKVRLNVEVLTEKPDIYIPEILEPERSVTLICAAPWVCGKATLPIFSWAGAALSNLRPSQGNPYFSELTFTPRSQDHGTNLTCQVIFPGAGVKTETTIPLNVAYSLKNFGISAAWEKRTGLESLSDISSLSIPKNKSLRLFCQADSNPPALLSWVHGGQVVLSSWPSGAGVLALELPRLGVEDGGEYSCQAQHRMETQHASLNLSVLYAPEDLKVSVLGPNGTVTILGNASSLVILVGESLHLECAADSRPPANMTWAKGSQPLSSSLLSSPGVVGLKLSHVKPEDGGKYTCQAQNPWGTQQTSLNLSVQYPPKLYNPFCSRTDEGLFCTCCIQAKPTSSLNWRVGESIVEGDSNNDTLQVMTITSGAWTNSSLILKEKVGFDLNLHCEGRNQHGAHSLMILLVSDGSGAAALTFSKGAFLGAGIMALLFVCLKYALKKLQRKKQEDMRDLGTTDSQSNGEVDYENLDMNWSRGTRLPSPDPVTQAPPEELHYASLNFKRLKPQDNQENQEENIK